MQGNIRADEKKTGIITRYSILVIRKRRSTCSLRQINRKPDGSLCREIIMRQFKKQSRGVNGGGIFDMDLRSRFC